MVWFSEEEIRLNEKKRLFKINMHKYLDEVDNTIKGYECRIRHEDITDEDMTDIKDYVDEQIVTIEPILIRVKNDYYNRIYDDDMFNHATEVMVRIDHICLLLYPDAEGKKRKSKKSQKSKKSKKSQKRKSIRK